MVVGTDGYVGAVRFSDGGLNVAAAVDRTALAEVGPAGVVDRILREAGLDPLPADPATGWKGTPPLTRRPSVVAGTRWFRIGDASGYVEPFTGEGMGWAIAAGCAVAPLALAGIDGWSEALATRWIRTHRVQIGRRQRLCRLLAGGLRRPRLVGGVAALLSRAPRLATPLVHATEAVGRA
jgi:flavin-dependent dehydrogenase